MKILHLEDNPRDAALVRDLLAGEWPDCFISVVATRDDFVSLLTLGGYDLILSDYQLPGFNGLDALGIVRELAPEIPFVFFSGTLGEESAIDAVRSGAADYVIKDRMQRLPMSVRRVLREATERRSRHQVEAALAKEQYLLRLLMENLPDRVYFKDLQSAFLAVSRSVASRVGLTAEQLKGRSDFEVFASDHARKAFEDEQRIIRTGEPLLNLEERETWPDGSVSWALTTKLPLRDASGAIIGTFGISRDITARKRDEERIREQAEIINEAPIAIIITDLTDRVTYCNASTARFLDLRPDEIVGNRIDEFLTPETSVRLQEARMATQQMGHWTGVVPVMTEKGRNLQAEIHLSQIADAAGQPRARLCIAIDVTEKMKLEEQFLRAQRLESLGMLAAGIAHDLNNVLSPILMGAPMLNTQGMHPADQRVLEAIESSASRGAALVRQILSFAQGAGGGKVLVQAKHLLQDMVALMRQTFPKNVRLDTDIPPHLWPVYGNPTQLHQIVLNLCVNARDAMPDGGTLRLHAENRELTERDVAATPDARVGRHLVIEVGDTGTGIPPEVLERIWDPFFTTKGEKGTGLGLATVRGIATSHEGFVTLETALGKGTLFRVFLPAAENGIPRPGPGAPAPAHGRGRGELLLVVDDEQSIRDLLVAILSHSGYRVLAAANGLEAISLYRPRVAEVALVLTDIGMPDMGGAELASSLKRINAQVNLLFITGAGPGGLPETAPDGGRSLPKPFTKDELLRMVRQLLDQPVT